MTICDYGELSLTAKRCRKHAEYAVGVHVLMGHQIGGQGEIPLYRIEVKKRCTDHAAVGLHGTFKGQLTLADYNRKLKEATHA